MAWIPIAASVAGAVAGSVLNRQRGPDGTQQISSDPWAPTVPYLNEYLQRIQGYSNTPAPYSSPDQMVAGLTPEQQRAAGMVSQGAQGAQQNVNAAQQGIMPFLQGQYMNVENNPYLQAAQQAAIRPVTQAYQENVLPGIQSQFSVGTDAFDQSREGIARGIASRGYLDTVGSISANMANRGYETGLQATQGAFSQIPGLMTASTAPGQAQWNIGALLQSQDQNMMNAPGMYDQMLQQRLAFPANLYTQFGQIGRQGTSITPGVSGSPYLGAVGGAVLGGQFANMFPQQTQQAPLVQDMVPGQFSTGNPQYG
jgi:hypothetical protein